MQVLQKAPRMADFRMASSRVGAEGGAALAEGLAAGRHPCWRTWQSALLSASLMLYMRILQHFQRHVMRGMETRLLWGLLGIWCIPFI